MNVIAHGIDMVDCSRLRAMIDKHGQRFLDRVFTPLEQKYCAARKRRVEHLAGRFAAKEAMLKVLGTGWRSGISWTDIEIRNDPSGKPTVRLAGRCRKIADKLGISNIQVSISHISTHAVASAIASRKSTGRASDGGA